jgi:HEAT repeat protein
VNPESQATNPYIGLRPFEQEDSLYFFGRREQTMKLLEQLSQPHFLAVVGSSGCGKSSLIRAGLIPALLGGFLVEERDAWQIAIMKPGDAPLRNLAVALCQAFDKAPGDAAIADVHAAISADHIQAAVSYLSSHLGTSTNLLLLIDQFEEIFSFRGAEQEEQTVQQSRPQRLERARRHAEADDFVDLMLGLKADTQLPVYIVLTMRTDFLGDCDLFYGLPEAMNESRYLVPRLTRQQLRQAIEGPALLSRTSLTPRLLDRLLNQLGDRADRLPVLQHALLRTWDIWRREAQAGPMDLQHYEAAGTLRHALSQHADEALRPEDRETTAKIFKCLIDTDPNHRRVRRPARLSELAAVTGQSPQVVRAILERFCDEGGRNFLVMSESADADDQRVDISHESLIRQWDMLKAWVDEERESRNQFLDLAYRGHRQLALLRDPDLQMALQWRDKNHPTAAWAKRYSTNDDDFDVAMQYLDESQQTKETAIKHRRHRRQLLGLTVIMLGLMVILYDVYRNFYSNYFSLSASQGPSENVELYQGNPKTWFNVRRYIAETDYQRWQIDPSVLFIKKTINDYQQMHSELINTLKPIEKLSAYWKSGNTDEAFFTILSAIKQYPERKQDIISVMSDFRSLETSEKFKALLLDPTLTDTRGTIVDVMALFPTTTTMEVLLSQLTHNAYPAAVRRTMVASLESISHTDFADGEMNKIIKSSLPLLLNDQLTNQATEEEKWVRLIAARTLMRLGDQRGVDQLIELASDAQSRPSDGQSRLGSNALEVLTGSRDEAVVQFLGPQLQVDERKALWIRGRIIEAAAQIGGSDVVEKFIQLIEDKNAQIRQRVVQALGRTGTPKAVPGLMNRLKEKVSRTREAEDEQPVRRNIVEALGRLMNNSDNPQANDAVREYLLKDVLPEFNTNVTSSMVRTTTEALGRIGNAATYTMLKNSTNHLNKSIIIDTLEALDDIRGIDDLHTFLNDGTSNDAEIHQRIAMALGRLGDASAVKHLQRVLHATQERLPDANTSKIRLSAVGALGRLGHKEALTPLQKMVEQQGVDRQDILYLGALEALGRLGDAWVLDDLIAWLQQGDSLMRRGNLEAMVGISTANWIARRLVSESGEEGYGRQVAVEVLGAFDSIRPRNLLLARLSDGSILAQRGAARALGRLGDADIRVVDLLIAHVDDGDNGVRQNAAEALGQLGHPRAVAPLIALLQDSQGDVRQAAADALGRLGDTRALQPLFSGFQGGQGRRQDGVEDARRAALLAYAKIGRTSAPEQTAGDLRAVFNDTSEHRRIRLAAAVALLELQPRTPPDAAIMEFLAVYANAAQSISNRRELSEMLGEFPSEPGRHILRQLLNDTNLSVLEHAIKSLGQSKDQDLLPTLHRYLEDTNFRLQKAAAEALAAIASAASIDALAASLNASDKASIPTRLACLKALSTIAKNPETGNDARARIVTEMLQAVKQDEPILGMRTYKLFGDLQARQALDHLQKRLDEEVASQHDRRRKRDASEEQARAEQDHLESVRLKSPLVFELAYNIARIDPRQSGLRLLHHDLADVRQGAWQGLGKVGKVDLIEELRQQLKTSNQFWFQRLRRSVNPFFRHAAYQAIDHILLRLEAEGDAQDLERLKRLVPGQVDDPCQQKESPEEQGICRRVKWTIARLAAKDASRASPTAAGSPN